MSKAITIGALARETGVKVPTIRYYESIGLLPTPPRTPSNRRLYHPDAAARLQFIRRARKLGFEVETVRQLLQLADRPEQPCDRVDAIARQHVSDIDRKIESLATMRTEIQHMLEDCQRGRIGECRILGGLAHHER
jgi:DNA-binding transcriptional MerR regulator